MKKFNLSGRRQFKKETIIANQKLKNLCKQGRLLSSLARFFVLIAGTRVSYVVCFLAAIAALYLGSSLTDSLTD